MYKIIQLSKLIDSINFSKDLNIFSLGCDSGNKIFKIEHKEINAEVASSYEDIIKSDKVDAVILATPHSKHLEQIVAAVNNGKHVFVEKPICLKLEHAEELKDVAKQKKLRIMVGHLLHFHDGFIEMKKILKTKELGNILKINSYRKSYGVCTW
mgnify:CR=1 FL=1